MRCRTSHQDDHPVGILQERAVAAYNTANSDGSVTKNDIKKLNTQMQAKTAHCDSMKATYANQMLKVNVVIFQNWMLVKVNKIL